jgi:predicted oxidoreductase
VVDARARVLDGGGQPIAGLYAAGGVTAALATSAPASGRSGLDALLALGLGRITALDVIAEVAQRNDQSGG